MDTPKSLTQDMKRSMDEVLAAIENLSDEAFNSQLITGRWACREILCHMAAWDCEFLEMSRALLDDRPIPQLPDFDTFNEKEVKSREHMSRKEIVMEVKGNRERYVDFISQLSPDQLQDAKGHRFTIEGLARDIISHDQYHLNQIENQLS
jgi:uncharacterized damage-inducible protein DinB